MPNGMRVLLVLDDVLAGEELHIILLRVVPSKCTSVNEENVTPRKSKEQNCRKS